MVVFYSLCTELLLLLESKQPREKYDSLKETKQDWNVPSSTAWQMKCVQPFSLKTHSKLNIRECLFVSSTHETEMNLN